MRSFAPFVSIAGSILIGGLITGCWERPPIASDQRGFRGTAMVEWQNPREMPAKLAANAAPEIAEPVPEGGPAASTIYKNVPVLGQLGVGEFTRTMVAMTNWVSPKEGCLYCHKGGEDFAADTLYTKIVARKMLQMTQAINSDNAHHVGVTGVTCYTCHRGQHIPQNVWFTAAPAKTATRMVGGDGKQNQPAMATALASLPVDGLTPYLSQAMEIRTASTTALPMSGEKRNRQDIKQTESTYSLMVHLSEGLGVNCTFCHNTQSFSSWQGSTPQRVTAWHGIRMTRSLNNVFMEPLVPVFPAERKGPTGDVAKVNCATCHQGANKPLLGAQMAKHYPAMSKAPVPAQPAEKVAVAPVVAAAAATTGSKVKK